MIVEKEHFHFAAKYGGGGAGGGGQGCSNGLERQLFFLFIMYNGFIFDEKGVFIF